MIPPRDLISGTPDTFHVPVIFCYENKTLILRVRRACCTVSVTAIVYDDEAEDTSEIACVFSGIDGDHDVFTAGFSPVRGLYYVTFRLLTGDGVYHIHSTGDEEHGELRKDVSECGRFQILVTAPHPSPDGAFSGSNMYHIFVDRFRKSGKCGRRANAVYIDDWDNGIPEYTEYPGMEMENNSFFGGDLYGITEKLPYIKELGCDIVYLSPVFEAYSNHRYDTGDYMKIDRFIGGEKAFSELCRKAHGLGMKIILDGVFNHTGAHSLYFNKYGEYGDGGAYRSKDSPYYDWYDFDEWPDRYKCWWGVKALPALRKDSGGFRELICGENGVIRKYLRLGADGWRLDVADELSDGLLDSIRAAADAEKPGSIIIGEVWEDASNKIAYGKRRHYFSDAQLDSVMDYPLRDAVIGYIKNGDSESFRHVFTVIDRHYPEDVKPYIMNFLGTHDTERIMTVFGGEPGNGLPGSVLVSKRMSDEQYVTATKRFIAAFSLLSFCRGITCVYYGDEAGMQGYRDPFNRMPYPWGREDKYIMSAVKRLLYLRKRFTAPPRLRYASDGVVIIERGEYVLLCNMSDKDTVIYTGITAEDHDGNTYTDEIALRSSDCIILEKTKEKKNDKDPQ